MDMEIITTVGGPCIYKRGLLEDGTRTGRVQYIGQSTDDLRKELLETMKTGRDDVTSFVDTIMSR